MKIRRGDLIKTEEVEFIKMRRMKVGKKRKIIMQRKKTDKRYRKKWKGAKKKSNIGKYESRKRRIMKRG